MPHSALPERFVVHVGRRIRLVPVDAVTHIAAEGNYARLYTAERTHLVRDTMAHLESRLGAYCFARIHRSVIVNLRYVHEVVPHEGGGYTVLLQDGTRLVASESFRACIDTFLKALV